MKIPIIEGLEIRGPLNPGYAEVLTPEACRFLAGLLEKFSPRRAELLARRVERQRAIDAGQMPDFLSEIPGRVDRKMSITALTPGAHCWMADLEDANSPTWENVMEGQINMRDAARR